MRRLVAIVALISLAIAVVAVGTRLTGTTAQETGPHGIVGAWHVTTIVEGAPQTPNLTTFYADGNVLTSNRPVFPPSAGTTAGEARSAGHGVWAAVDDHTVDLTFVVLTAATDGTPLGSRTLSAHLTLAVDRMTWSAPFTATIADTTGAVVQTVAGRVEATRITIEPMAAGTPAAGA